MTSTNGAETQQALIAVCVCTRGRPLMLRRCLVSLQQQELAPNQRMHVVVVDNDAEPKARPVYDEILGQQTPISFVHCVTQGIPFARNAAIDAALAAGADFIAFLDDDECAPRHWLRALTQALTESGADAIQGGVRKGAGDVASLAAAEPAPAQTPRWEASESLATCNVLMRAHLARPPLALRFDESMQFTGGSDREFFMRAHKRGAKIVRLFGVDVFEEVAEGRETLAYECNRAYAAGSNYFARMVRNEPAPTAAARIGLRALSSLTSGALKLIAAALLALALRGASALKQARKGCANLCFAAGCLTPIIGVRSYPYRTIQGA